MSGTTDVVVWYDGGACTVFDAPAMSLADGFVHEDNNIDWSDPDDGIYWERSCVYMLDADGRGPAEASPRVVDPETGEVIAEFDTQAHAEEYAEYLSAQGRKAVPSESAGDEPPSASEAQIYHRRTCLITGAELAGALAVEVRGKTVLIRSEAAETDCGLLDVTDQAAGYGRDADSPVDAETIEVDDDDEAPSAAPSLDDAADDDDDEYYDEDE